MKAQILRIVLTFSLFGLISAATANAQVDGLIRVHIPFDFIVSEQTLPSGDYIVERGMTIDPNVLLISSADRKTNVYVGAESAYRLKTPADTFLSFDEVDNKYFLREVWRTGQDVGREIPRSREERNLQRSENQLTQTIKIHMDATGRQSQTME